MLSQSALEDYSLTKEELRTRLLLLAFVGLVSAKEKYLYSDMFTEIRDLSLYRRLYAAFFRGRLKSADLSFMNDYAVSKHMNTDIKEESSGEEDVPPSVGKSERQSDGTR